MTSELVVQDTPSLGWVLKEWLVGAFAASERSSSHQISEGVFVWARVGNNKLSVGSDITRRDDFETRLLMRNVVCRELTKKGVDPSGLGEGCLVAEVRFSRVSEDSEALSQALSVVSELGRVAKHTGCLVCVGIHMRQMRGSRLLDPHVHFMVSPEGAAMARDSVDFLVGDRLV